MSNEQNVPFLDLAGLHQDLEKELVPIFQKALDRAVSSAGRWLRNSSANSLDSAKVITVSASQAGRMQSGLH